MEKILDADPQLVEMFKRMTADVERAFTFFGGIEHLRSWFTEWLLDDRAIVADGAALCLRRNAQLRSETIRLLGQTTEPQSHAFSDAVKAAFENADPLVRGIAWRLLMETSAEPQFSTTADSRVADEFVRRLPKGVNEDDHARLARSFLIAVRGSVAIFRGRAFCRGLVENHYEGSYDADAPHLCFVQNHDPACRLAGLRGLAGAAGHPIGNSVMIPRMVFADPDPEVRFAAILAYADVYRGTSEPECLRLLANLVVDELLPLPQRVAAYGGLFKICRGDLQWSSPYWADSPERDWQQVAAIDSQWRAEIDWEFVERCRMTP